MRVPRDSASAADRVCRNDKRDGIFCSPFSSLYRHPVARIYCIEPPIWRYLMVAQKVQLKS